MIIKHKAIGLDTTSVMIELSIKLQTFESPDTKICKP